MAGEGGFWGGRWSASRGLVTKGARTPIAVNGSTTRKCLQGRNQPGGLCPRPHWGWMTPGAPGALPPIPEASGDQPSRFFFMVTASSTMCPGTELSVSSVPSRLYFLSLFLCRKSLLNVDLKEKVRVLFKPQETKKDIRPRKGPPYHKDKCPFSLLLMESGATKNKVNFRELTEESGERARCQSDADPIFI